MSSFYERNETPKTIFKKMKERNLNTKMHLLCSQPHNPGSCGRVPLSSFYLKFLSTFRILPQILSLIFVLNLAFQVDDSPTWETTTMQHLLHCLLVGASMHSRRTRRSRSLHYQDVYCELSKVIKIRTIIL